MFCCAHGIISVNTFNFTLHYKEELLPYNFVIIPFPLHTHSPRPLAAISRKTVGQFSYYLWDILVRDPRLFQRNTRLHIADP